MGRGGYRPNSGPAKGTKYRTRGAKKEPGERKRKGFPVDILEGASAAKLTPLAYMLRVMNDVTEPDKARQDRMAIAAAPFCHPRIGEGLGKKEEKNERAKRAGKGRFKASSPPVLKLVGSSKSVRSDD